MSECCTTCGSATATPEDWVRERDRLHAEVERLREARSLALAELTGLDAAALDSYEQECLNAAVRVLVGAAKGGVNDERPHNGGRSGTTGCWRRD